MKGEQKQVSNAVKNVAQEVKKDAKKDYDEMAANILKKGVLPSEALGMDEQMLEGIYGQAYRLYNTGKYAESGQIFRLLIMINSLEPKYSMGLAACFHMLKEYKNAIDTYNLTSIIDPENPIPQYHISDCYIKLGDKVSAIIALKLAIKRASNKPEYQTLIDRSKMTIESLKNDLKKEGDKKIS